MTLKHLLFSNFFFWLFSFVAINQAEKTGLNLGNPKKIVSGNTKPGKCYTLFQTCNNNDLSFFKYKKCIFWFQTQKIFINNIKI